MGPVNQILATLGVENLPKWAAGKDTAMLKMCIRDRGRGDKDTDMGRAVCAGQGQGVGDGDRVGSLGVQGQRVAENAVPSGIGRIVTGNTLQYIRRQGHGIGGRRAEHHLPPRGVDEQKALDVGCLLYTSPDLGAAEPH